MPLRRAQRLRCWHQLLLLQLGELGLLLCGSGRLALVVGELLEVLLVSDRALDVLLDLVPHHVGGEVLPHAPVQLDPFAHLALRTKASV